MKPRALTIAGSDPSGGAGMQQDLAVFGALGVWGLSAVTAITAQDTAAVHRWQPVDPDLVQAQIDAVVVDIGVDAAKIGMLGSRDVVGAVAEAVARHGISALILDPVLVATSGAALATEGALEALRRDLVPLALLVTPNAAEAEALTGIQVDSRATQTTAGRALVRLGARAALVKGGHLPGPDAVDILIVGDVEHELSAPRVPVGDVRGTGCVLSAAIAASVALGRDVEEAVGDAKSFLTAALQRARKIGHGALVIDAHAGGG